MPAKVKKIDLHLLLFKEIALETLLLLNKNGNKMDQAELAYSLCCRYRLGISKEQIVAALLVSPFYRSCPSLSFNGEDFASIALFVIDFFALLDFCVSWEIDEMLEVFNYLDFFTDNHYEII